MGLNEPQVLGVFSDASMDENELSDIKAMHAGDTLDIFYDTREKNKAWKWLLLPSYSICQI